MITKQQALEFIHELFNHTTVYINLEKGKMYVDVYVDYEEGITGTYIADIGFKPQSHKLPLLEELVTKFIKVNQGSNLFNNFDKIPVDVDMLEVGQTYKVELDDFYDGCHSVHIAKYTGEEEGYYYFKNRHTWRYEKKDLYQLWKMNNKENEVQ